jgi:hypothetical protein
MLQGIIHRPVLYFKHNVSEIEFYLRFQVKPTQLDPVDRASPSSLWTIDNVQKHNICK